MWHTKTKILKGSWVVARYVEKKRNKVLYKLLGTSNLKNPDYGENEFEKMALERRRQVHAAAKPMQPTQPMQPQLAHPHKLYEPARTVPLTDPEQCPL